MLALVLAAALPMALPIFRFAQPKGPYAIGTVTYHWMDGTRPEAFAADRTKRRQLMAQVWYPAQTDPSAPRAAYMPDADPVMTAFARLQGKPAFLFGHFRYVSSNAIMSGRPAIAKRRFPVLLFLEGAIGYRQMNTFQVEHLVSHGYIVVAIDQPGAAAAVVFPDGDFVLGLTVPQLHAMVGPSYLPQSRGLAPIPLPLPNGSSLRDNSSIPYLAQDVAFSLDQLGTLDRSDPAGILTGVFDLQRIGAFGVSLGGIVVGEACRSDARLRACLMMDAPMSATVVTAGLHQPAMWITRDAASMRLERQRAGGWPDEEIEAHQRSMRAAYDGMSSDGYFVRVPGMFHSNFTDVPIWTPLARWVGLAGPIDSRRAHAVVNAFSLAFFDKHLLGRGTLMHGAAEEYPEVLLESRRP